MDLETWKALDALDWFWFGCVFVQWSLGFLAFGFVFRKWRKSERELRDLKSLASADSDSDQDSD